jgi:uncharacterized protein involved in tolerance to divalent cations
MNYLLSVANRSCLTAAVSVALLTPGPVAADGVVVSKIYDPYVQPLETELEWRMVDQNDDQLPDLQKHSLGFGRSLSDRWAIELYAIGEKGSGESLSIDTYEFEVKWQLTEQGEYAFDWGVLFELEREVEDNAWELATSLLASRDFGRVTATANLGLIYEWGQGIENEFETALHVQTRYRLKEAIEPAIELHMGQDTIALGPAVTGLIRVSQGKKLRWELGIFAGVDDDSPDQTIKANIEFEF